MAGGGANEIYYSHLFGAMGKYQNNPGTNRENLIGSMHKRVLTELAVSRFKWENLPETIDPRFLEMTLFYTALAIFYKDKDYDKFLAVRGAGAGYVNMLDNPVSFNVIGPGTKFPMDSDMGPAMWYNKTLSAYDPARHADDPKKEDKCVPIWANFMRMPDHDIVEIYSKRLAWIDRTLEINSRNARQNKIIKGGQNIQLSLVNLARSMDQGEELIQASAGLDTESMEVLDLGIDSTLLDSLAVLRARVWNEVMGLFGIDNANQDKKERLVAAEVGANDSQTDTMRDVSLMARRHAADQINEVFGLDISVDFNVEIEAKADAEENAQLMQQSAPAGPGNSPKPKPAKKDAK